MRRREFITLLGGAATWPLAARAQQDDRLRRIGVLINLAADDPQGQVRLAAFQQGLQQLGWTDGHNLRIDTRWTAGNADNIRKYATELAVLAPDVIFAHGSATAGPLLQATRTVPIVFVYVPDPVGAGFVESLSRPGGNATGFTGAIQSVGSSFGIALTPVGVRDVGEIERAITAFARSLNGGLIVTASALAVKHRGLIVTLAARHKLPAVYYERFFATAGGLISYGPDTVDQFRRGASYVDRILKGEKPADLPVQTPIKYQLVVNLKTAKALGLEMPSSLLARADEVIE